MYFELTDSFVVSGGLDRCWEFFGSAENLPLITPPWLHFRLAMAAPYPRIEQDTLLDYTIRWCGIPIRWRTRIIDWDPPRTFIDLQVRGPYALWHHQHSFKAVDGGVECRDRVIYQLPMPIVRAMVHPLLVKRQLIEIFQFRRETIARNLGEFRALQDKPTIIRL